MSKLLRVHKQILVHGSILLAFLVYAFFLAGPLFNRFEASKIGLSNLRKISLPIETNEMYCDISGKYSNLLLSLLGWAFIPGQSAEGSQFYVVLQSADNTYVFDTFLYPMPDVNNKFARLNLKLANLGFGARVPIKKIDDGTYRVGIYIKKKHVEALQYTDKVFVKFQEVAKLTVRTSRLQKISLPQNSNNIRFAIDIVKEEKDLILIRGWAFIDGQGSEGSKIYLVLKSEDNTYVFDTFLQSRPDVTNAFKQLGLNLNNSGFIARIPKKDVEIGEYIGGLYITKGDMQSLQYLDKAIVKSKGSAKLTVRTPRLQKISLPQNSNNIRFAIDIVKEEKDLILIRGWAFIDGQGSEGSKIYLVLKSEDNTYVFDTFLQSRPDVTNAFKQLGLNLNSSGFIARIPQKDVERGTYRLGIYINKGPFKTLHHTEKIIELK